MSEGLGWMTRFPDAPHHRYAEQLQFLKEFPAYTTEADGDRLALWYWRGDAPQRLLLHAAPGGVTVDGDIGTAQRVFHVDAPSLLPMAALPAEPPAHRILYRRYAGIRPVLFADAFEGIAWTILGQQVTVGLAGKLKRNVATRYGCRIDGIFGPVTLFPRPGALTAISIDDFRVLHLSRQKAETLLTITQSMHVGQWRPDVLYEQPTNAAIAELQRFRGIGQWSAEYILLRVVGHPDVLPAGDVALQRAWTRLTGATTRLGEADLRHAGEAWAGWRSDFAFYLWLDNLAIRASRPTQNAH